MSICGRLKLSTEPGRVVHAFNHSTQELLQMDLCEFKSSLVYILSSISAKASYTECLRVSIAVMKHHGQKKQVGEERVFMAYTSTALFIIEGSQGSSKRSHGGMLLTGLLPMACSACFLIEPRAISPGMALIKKLPYSWMLWNIFLIKVPSFQLTLACVD